MKTVTFYGLAVVLAVLLDQAVKWAVEAYLPFHQLVPVLPFLGLFRTYNTGVAFSMFSGSHDLLLLLLALAVIGFVLYLAWKSEPGQRWARAGFTLVIGGAVGNLIDRGVHGHVID
ncbi:MAG: signal peptidase II [Mesorhizobium amorphae]|nr:MAG: signal peptidase II [Mesorhizobium amorphae]